ncbi:MAG: type II toxin-antitoxin system Phd/YefM family antitoxin [Beijerinckiaceae bacterium]
MKHVSAAEANRNFSRLLGSVGRGEGFVITSHGKPMAKLVPVDDATAREARDRAAKELFDDLRSRPAQNHPRVTRDEIYDYLDE